jgi:hypothetical protein
MHQAVAIVTTTPINVGTVMSKPATAKKVAVTKKQDPVLLMWDKLQKLDKKAYDASLAADIALDNLPENAKRARVQIASFVSGLRGAEEPIYAYSEEEIIANCQQYLKTANEDEKSKLLAQQERLLDEFRKDEVRVKKMRDQLGYTSLKQLDDSLFDEYSELDYQLSSTIATSLEGIKCQAKRLYEYYGLDENEDGGKEEQLIKSIKLALDQLSKT